ncbi:MAG: GGDEF domain-containing protein [Peptoanaerobacter stomatis]|uniref:GGDEF domain-containing protein n=1 Tax=Peptoanaerobacter stomatis TaxID=796937 RepID=UPI003FA131FF
MSIKDKFFLIFYEKDEKYRTDITYILLATGSLVVHIIYHIFFIKHNKLPLIQYNIFSVCFYLFLVIFRKKVRLNKFTIVWNIEVMLFATLAIIKIGFGYGFELLFLILMSTDVFLMDDNIFIKMLVIFFEAAIFFRLLITKKFVWNFDPAVIDFYILNFLAYFFSVNVVNYSSLSFFEIKNKFENMKLVEEKERYKKIAEYDILTGLVRKFYMEQQLDEAIDDYNCKRLDNLVLIFSDIDDFKNINDTYGHPNGDIVLARVGAIFKRNFRKDDIICRWGGEEFLILMKNVRKGFAYNIIDKLREKVSKQNFSFDDVNVSITMTFGVCAVYDSKITYEELIKTADDLLYEGKHSGKNKVVYKEI